MEISVTSAKNNEKDILANLIQLYLHDFSEFEALEISEAGRYEYPYLPHYWEDPNRYPFLIRVDEKLAGFALLRFEVDPANGREQMHMAEFFIMRRFRRQGVGEQAAKTLWDLFPGSWETKVLATNQAAYRFWRKIISEYSNEEFEEIKSEEPVSRWTVFNFESTARTDMPDNIEMDSMDFF